VISQPPSSAGPAWTVAPHSSAAPRGVLALHEGREVRSTGDGLVVAFSSATTAVLRATAMQRALTADDPDQALRIGIDTGEPVAGGDDLHGTPVIVILDAEPDIRVVGEAADGRQAVAMARNRRPAVGGGAGRSRARPPARPQAPRLPACSMRCASRPQACPDRADRGV
jgi:hypothetical protein